MKKRIVSIVLVLLMVLSLVPSIAFAEDNPYIRSGSCGENATWTLDISTRTLTISGTGEMYNYHNNESGGLPPWGGDKSYIETVVVGEGITSISNSAFYEHKSLNSIRLPSTLRSIGNYAFSFNRALNQITIPDGVASIGTYAFYYCDGLTSLELPNNLKVIESDVFACCRGLSHITIPASVEVIQDDAFTNCSSGIEFQFEGDMPSFKGTPFEYASGTILYPCTNTTWDPVFFSDFGGTLTWEKNHGDMDYSAATVDAENNAIIGKCPTCQQNCTLQVDQISCKNSTFPISISTKTEQTYSISCADGCQLTYARTGSSSISAGSYYSGTYTYGVRISDTGLHKLKISGSAGGNDLYYTVFVRDHSYSSSVVAPTCTEKGYTTYTCTWCGNSYTSDYTDAGHHIVADKAVEATCGEAGHTVGSHCDRCGEVFIQSEVIPATGEHHFVDGKCEVCGCNAVLPGDVDGNGKINMVDVTKLRQYLTNKTKYPLDVEAAADVDNSGKINMVDVTKIRQYLTNKDKYPLG